MIHRLDVILGLVIRATFAFSKCESNETIFPKDNRAASDNFLLAGVLFNCSEAPVLLICENV